jgi:molybdopterin molybdotransferase
LESLKAFVGDALDADLIVTSGGVSVGEADFTKEAFASFGYEIFFDKIQIKPGKPTTFGKIGKTFVLNLPGNPLAAALNFELFGKAIVLSLGGNRQKYQNVIETKMADDYKVKTNRSTLIPGYFDGKSFTPYSNFAPGMVRPLSASNGFIILSGGIDGMQKDTKVSFIPTRFDFHSDKQVDLESS